MLRDVIGAREADGANADAAPRVSERIASFMIENSGRKYNGIVQTACLLLVRNLKDLPVVKEEL